MMLFRLFIKAVGAVWRAAGGLEKSDEVEEEESER